MENNNKKNNSKLFRMIGYLNLDIKRTPVLGKYPGGIY